MGEFCETSPRRTWSSTVPSGTPQHLRIRSPRLRIGSPFSARRSHFTRAGPTPLFWSRSLIVQPPALNPSLLLVNVRKGQELAATSLSSVLPCSTATTRDMTEIVIADSAIARSTHLCPILCACAWTSSTPELSGASGTEVILWFETVQRQATALSCSNSYHRVAVLELPTSTTTFPGPSAVLSARYASQADARSKRR